MINRVLFIGYILLFIGLSYSQDKVIPEFTGKVVGVSDGDTYKIMRDGKAVKVRLYGIDCPEKAQDFGQVAKQFASDLVFGKNVKVEITDTDRYGRFIGKVYTESGVYVNAALVEAGMAWWYRAYAKNDTELERLETAARQAKRGLWAMEATPPWEWRKNKRNSKHKMTE